MDDLAPYHFGHLPVWISGNAYFAGADVSRHEKNGFCCEDGPVSVELEMKDGNAVLKTNLYELLGDFRAGVITSDTLGCAFEPEQRFENPDGSSITFDTDYFGAHRGIAALPGPFAEGAAELRVL